LRAILRFFRRYLGTYAWWYLGGLVALFVTAWLGVTIPLELAAAIDVLAKGGHEEALGHALRIAGMGVVIVAARTASRVLFFTPGRLVETRIKDELFSHFLRQQPPFHREHPAGDLMSRMSSDTNYLRLLGGFAALSFAHLFVTVGLSGVQMFRVSPVLAPMLLPPLLVGMAVTQLSMRRLQTAMRQVQKDTSALSEEVLTGIRGVATIQAFTAESAFQSRFEEHNQKVVAGTLAVAQYRTLVGPALGVAASLDVFLILWFGSAEVEGGRLTAGELVALITLLATVVGPLRGVGFLISMLKQAEAAWERVEVLLNEAPLRPEGSQGLEPEDQAPAISIRGLTAAFGDRADQPVLADVSVEVAAGTTLGVFGATGSGKTTLLRILARLHNPPPGTVFIDGRDILSLDLDHWRKRLAMVPQKPFLFGESVRENILLGQGAEADLARAVEATALSVDLAALPHGVETVVGETGITLSGGQRQRVALARGLVRPHRLILLDDVLSAVDHHTERDLVDTLVGAANRATTVLVSHRISALRHAQLIIVLDQGRIVAQGSHAELASRPGPYREAWARQQANPEAAA
jgi:ATP-binding cassette subfamily B multidrug efflux pump